MADDRVFRVPTYLKNDVPDVMQHEVLRQLYKEVLVPWSIPVSLVPGNAISILADGLYATTGSGDVWPGLSKQEGNITTISTEDGKVYTPCCVVISKEAGNTIVMKSDGLFAPGGGWPGISADEGNTTILSPNDGKVFTPGWPGVSLKAGNTIVLLNDGIYSTAGGGGWPGLSLDSGNIAVISTKDGGVYVPCCVKVSDVSGNILEQLGDGSLYVPDTYPGVDPRGDNVLEEHPEGLFVPPCLIELELSKDTGNILQFGTDGLLYAPCCYPGISKDSGNIIVSGIDGGIYAATGAINILELISGDANNCLIPGTDGKLWVKCTGSSGPWPGISDDADNCLGTGKDGGLYIACFHLEDQISGEAGNRLRLSTKDDRLFVPPTDGPSWLPLLFDLDMQTTVRAMIPRDRTFITIEAFDPPGDSLQVSIATSYYADPAVAVPLDPDPMLDVTMYQNKEVTFFLTGRPVGDFTTVSAMVRLE